MNIRFISIALLFPWLSFSGYANGDLQTRFEKSLNDAKRLHNVEVNFLDTLWMPHGGANQTAFSRTIHYSYIASGARYRAKSELVSGTETNLAKLFESAFDGKAYSAYDGRNRYVTRSSSSPPGDNARSAENPLVAPFLFLTQHSDVCMQCALHFTDIVSLTNATILPKGRSSRGAIEISMQGPPLAKQPTTWKVALDETGDSFTPRTVSVAAPGAKIQLVYRLLNYTNLGGYEFPTTIEWSTSAYPPTFPPTALSTGLVAVISARVPDPIADSVFRLDRQEASTAVVWDWDKHKLIKAAPELARVQFRSRTVRGAFVLMLLTTGIFIFVLVRKLSSKT